jgi:hypothetical protein
VPAVVLCLCAANFHTSSSHVVVSFDAQEFLCGLASSIEDVVNDTEAAERRQLTLHDGLGLTRTWNRIDAIGVGP